MLPKFHVDIPVYCLLMLIQRRIVKFRQMCRLVEMSTNTEQAQLRHENSQMSRGNKTVSHKKSIRHSGGNLDTGEAADIERRTICLYPDQKLLWEKENAMTSKLKIDDKVDEKILKPDPIDIAGSDILESLGPATYKT